MSDTTLDIEIHVSRSPGQLSISSYSDVTTDTLDAAIAEAQRFIAGCEAVKADIAAHGLGKRPPRAPLPSNWSQMVSDAAAEAFAETRNDLFASSALFQTLKGRR